MNVCDRCQPSDELLVIIICKVDSLVQAPHRLRYDIHTYDRTGRQDVVSPRCADGQLDTTRAVKMPSTLVVTRRDWVAGSGRDSVVSEDGHDECSI